jgi:hypothetical protein
VSKCLGSSHIDRTTYHPPVNVRDAALAKVFVCSSGPSQGQSTTDSGHLSAEKQLAATAGHCRSCEEWADLCSCGELRLLEVWAEGSEYISTVSVRSWVVVKCPTPQVDRGPALLSRLASPSAICHMPYSTFLAHTLIVAPDQKRCLCSTRDNTHSHVTMTVQGMPF